MTADAFPRPYLVLGPGGSNWSTRGYHILSQEGGSSQQHAYVLASTGSGVISGSPSLQSYAVLSNPSSVTAKRAYGAIRHDVSVHSLRGYVVLSTFYPPYEELDVEYAFCERQFPVSVSYGSSGGPGFKTSIFSVDSGIVHANPEWERLRARYEIEFDQCPREDIEQVENFFYGMRGKAIGFRFKDWNDYQIVNQNVVVGDGNSKEFQLFKRYRSGGNVFDRMIRKPVRNQLGTLTLDGQEMILNRDYYLNYTNGAIVFNEAPPAGSIGHLDYAEFDVPVRFDTDELSVSAEDFNQYSISSLSMIEVLV
ncbi:gene transfer agent [Phaeobacter phage MD18]|nr:gene transfer agent [Phaeobacter phage MD18]